MSEMAAAYAGARTRIEELVGTLGEDDLARRVPACPDWNVKELVAHVTGIAADTLAANIAEMGRPDWTEKQVAERRERRIEEILAEWNELGPQLEQAADGWHPTAASALIGDVIVHEHDIRGALGDKNARDTDGVVIATSFYARNFGKRLKDAGLPTVIVKCGDHEWTAGREEPQGYVRAPLFEMLRGLTGRRTSDEVKGFDWTIDAAQYLDLFPMYPVTETSLDE
jgi:uncharacterized protein (TIGR03083 family)